MLRLIYCVSIANAVLIVPVRYNCTEEIPCTAWREPNVQYRRVSWYKVNSDSSLSSLINKSLRVNNSTILYTSVKKAYKINENCSLTLPGIESEDLGIYRCLLWAPVGHKMQNGDVKLTLEGIEIKELSERLESPLSIPEKSGYSNSLLGHVVLSTVVCSFFLLVLTIAVLIIRQKNYVYSSCLPKQPYDLGGLLAEPKQEPF